MKSLNEQLRELYSKYAESFIELDRRLFCAEREDGNLGIPHSAPQLISLSGKWKNCKGEKFSRNWEEAYCNSAKKVLFVGQDPKYWYKVECDRGCFGLDWPNALTTTTDIFVPRFSVPYLEFNLGKGNDACFWSFIHSIYDNMDKRDNFVQSYLYTNLFKVGVSTNPTKARISEKDVFQPKFLDKMYKKSGVLNLLRDEVAILKPDLIFFLTGNGFDDVIYNVFCNCNAENKYINRKKLYKTIFESVDGWNIDSLACINLSSIEVDLPWKEESVRFNDIKAFRCYHPNYLRYNPKLREKTLEFLKKQIFE